MTMRDPPRHSRRLRAALIGAAVAATGALAAAACAAPKGLELVLPLRCEIGRTCEVQNYVDADPGPGAKDYRCLGRTYQGHSGVDIRLLDLAHQKAGVEVLAAAAGKVARLRDGVADVSIRDPGAPSVEGTECGNGIVIDHGQGWETQYCHLARGSVRVKVGQAVSAGEPIARVGLSGDTEFPHLHLTVRHLGTTVDPFAPDAAPGACGGNDGSLWAASAQRQLAYKRGAFLTVGFAPGPVTQAQVDGGSTFKVNTASPALVAWIRLIGLEAGDVLTLELRDPAGAILARQQTTPLDHNKAQQMLFVGKKRREGNWAPGPYVARAAVIRDGREVLSRRFEVRLGAP